MRIGIIGGGAAGLTAAWLLSEDHDVTLFEAEARLGGHAHTVHVDRDGSGARVPVEAGFEFFSRKGWPTFNRLLDVLGVARRDYAARVAVHEAGARRAHLLQPFDINGRLVPSMLTPARLLDLSQFGLLLASVRPLMEARDTSVTAGQVIDRAPLTRRFREDFLFPFLLAGWCVEPEAFREFSAYNALRYAYLGVTPRGAAPLQEVVGGMTCYLAALTGELSRATLRFPARVAGLQREPDGLRVREEDGRSHAFDHVLIATNAREAARLLSGVPGGERMAEQAARIEYFWTTIAVHGDATYMPQHPDDWSIVNVRRDARHAQTTVWKPWRGPDLFRSWITYDERPPRKVHAIARFEHPMPDLRYFEVQRALQAAQGRDGLWLAGLHLHDIDSHESALRSAMHVAARLAPTSRRLAQLTAGA